MWGLTQGDILSDIGIHIRFNREILVGLFLYSFNVILNNGSEACDGSTPVCIILILGILGLYSLVEV